MVECTYLEIPQVPRTYEVLLSRPFWLWGCEMGINELGVAIGNEAVFTKEPYSEDPGLIGMDLIRLALERADTARRALDVIVTLVETYGQGGNCGFRHDLYYHNAFIIGDPKEAWVLETAGSFWAAERVRGTRSISNGLTIGSEWDLASPELIEHALDRGWCKSREDFHFARCYSDRVYTPLNGCRIRHRRSMELLQAQTESITPKMMMGFLRDHSPHADPSWDPSRGLLMNTLCVHAGFGPTRPSQSTAAMVAHLTPDRPTCWLTGTSATCTSVFKPIYLNGGGLPNRGPEPNGSYDPESLWWKHERLHRTVIRDYATRIRLYEKERDALETAFLSEARAMREISGERRLAEFTGSCFQRADEATERWTQTVSEAAIKHSQSVLFRAAWNRFNSQANFAQQKQA
jgi:dipeptidase